MSEIKEVTNDMRADAEFLQMCIKEINYSYPTSLNAVLAGKPWVGCWTVSLSLPGVIYPFAISHHATEFEANAAADAMPQSFANFWIAK